MTKRILSFEGHNRSGIDVYGIIGWVEPTVFVQDKFCKRWRDLTVKADGELVGAIFTSPETGKRTWWAES